MTGFETIVRPVVFPAIRPAPARPLAPADDPEKGIATLGGSGGGLIDLSASETNSWSKTHLVEVQRRVDVVRINQEETDEQTGKKTINEDNYIEVEEVNKMWMQGSNGSIHTRDYVKADLAHKDADNVEILERDVIKKNPAASGNGGAP